MKLFKLSFQFQWIIEFSLYFLPLHKSLFWKNWIAFNVHKFYAIFSDRIKLSFSTQIWNKNFEFGFFLEKKLHIFELVNFIQLYHHKRKAWTFSKRFYCFNLLQKLFLLALMRLPSPSLTEHYFIFCLLTLMATNK